MIDYMYTAHGCGCPVIVSGGRRTLVVTHNMKNLSNTSCWFFFYCPSRPPGAQAASDILVLSVA